MLSAAGSASGPPPASDRDLVPVPFAPAHAAAALPLARLVPRLPLPALVVGTMAPDFEYLLRLAPRGNFGHTPLGLLAFCLPVGLLVWIAYEGVARPALAGAVNAFRASGGAAATTLGYAVVGAMSGLAAATLAYGVGAGRARPVEHTR